MGDTGSQDQRERTAWQKRLLPFLIIAISLMAAFFFASSLLQLGKLGDAVAFHRDDRITQALAAYERTVPQDADYVRWKATVLLEQTALDHRYAQVNATLMLRAWTRHLGFLTGMILALVGSIFILARLSEAETQLSSEGGGAKLALATSSPGIVLAVLGTVLMVVTLTIDFQFTTSDTPIYLRPAVASVAAPLPPPSALDTDTARRAEEKDLFGGQAGGKDAGKEKAR